MPEASPAPASSGPMSPAPESIQHYLVVDFEATCCDLRAPPLSVPREEMEIIEIGAVLVDAATLQPQAEFQSFVRPVRHPRLTAFCTQLTSIRQQDLDAAPGFVEMAAALGDWLRSERRGPLWFCSWGDFDRAQWQQDCAYHRIDDAIAAPHRDLKTLFLQRQGLERCVLERAMRLAGLRFAGTQHRGIDDARNIARLLPWIFGDARLAGAGA